MLFCALTVQFLNDVFVQRALLQQYCGPLEGLRCIRQQQTQVLMKQHNAVLILHTQTHTKSLASHMMKTSNNCLCAQL